MGKVCIAPFLLVLYPFTNVVKQYDPCLGKESVYLNLPGLKRRTKITQNKTFRINVTEQFPEHNSTVRIHLYRSLSQSNLVEWESKRMTGMSVEWDLEDDTSDTEEVEEKKACENENKCSSSW